MDYSYLSDILVLLSAAVAVVVVFLLLRLPPILGYLSIGILMGPHALALIEEKTQIRALAEFGVVFLLFTVGLEFSLSQLIRMRRAVIGLGGTQVLLSILITVAVSLFLGLPLAVALVLGGAAAMSSTALVVKQLTDQLELQMPHGRNAVGILLFQDLMVIPFVILIGSLRSCFENPVRDQLKNRAYLSS